MAAGRSFRPKEEPSFRPKLLTNCVSSGAEKSASLPLPSIADTASLLLLVLSFPLHKNRHFDRSCSRFCEQRSGEIRFSTQTLTQPKRLCLLLPTPYSLPLSRSTAHP